MTVARDAMALPAEYRAPGTGVEHAMCRCYAEALRLDRVGLDDDFFDLGGDSLGAERLLLLWRETALPAFPITKLISLGTPGRVVAWILAQDGQDTLAATSSTSRASDHTPGLRK